jgi:hypothetical protein
MTFYHLAALRYGKRGLSDGSSLAKLLAEEGSRRLAELISTRRGRCQEACLAETSLADECPVSLEEHMEIKQRTFEAHPLSSTMLRDNLATACDRAEDERRRAIQMKLGS